MRKTLLLAVIACFILPQIAFGGAWTLPKHGLWGEYAVKWNWADDDFNGSAKRVDKTRDAKTWGWSMNPKVEFGLTDKITLMGGLEYKEASYKEYARPVAWGPYSVKNHALTSIDGGVKVKLVDKPLVVSGQFKGIFYTEYQDKALEDVAEAPELGDRTNAYEVRVLASKKWETEIPFYLGAETGYRYNEKNIHDQVPFFVEAGFWPLSWLLVKSEVDGFFGIPSTSGKGAVRKEYAIVRVGPSIELLELFDVLTGRSYSEGDGSVNSVTRGGRSLSIDVQYGFWFWGRNVSADQEVVLKIAGQY